MSNRPLCDALSGKVGEQVELIQGLIRKLPGEKLAWAPPGGDNWTTARLLGHLLDCLAGMCAVLYAANPPALAHFARLRDLPVNHNCGRDEADSRIPQYAAAIAEGFSVLTEADLARAIPTVFVPAGETLLTLILGNLEHITNHKHELFTRLRQMGVPVASRDLYRFRG